MEQEQDDGPPALELAPVHLQLGRVRRLPPGESKLFLKNKSKNIRDSTHPPAKNVFASFPLGNYAEQ